MAVFLKHVNYVEILEINCKYQLKYRIEKYQYRLKSLILYRYHIVPNFPVSPITTGCCKIHKSTKISPLKTLGYTVFCVRPFNSNSYRPS